jgi:hypothetical protein
MKWDRRFGLLLLSMMALRWLMLTLLLFGIPRLPLRADWLIYPQGDQELIFFAAFHLSRGIVRPTVAGFGQVLVMLFFWNAQDWPLWVRFIRPWTGRHVRFVSYLDIMPDMVFFNAFLLGGLSIMLVGLLARAVTGRKSIGLATAAWWLVFPYLIVPIRCLHLDPGGSRADIVPTLLWMNGLSDGPGFFFVLLSTWLASLCLRRSRAWLLASFGVSLAVSITFRAATLPAVLVLWAVVAYRLGWRGALIASGAAALAYVPQAAYNQAAFGFPLTSGSLYVGAEPGVPRNLSTDPLSTFLHFDPRYPGATIAQFIARCPLLMASLPIAGLVVAWGMVALWRQHGWERAALLAAPLPYLGAVVMFVGFRQDPVRYTMLAYPHLMTAIAYAAWHFWRRSRTAHLFACIGVGLPCLFL